MSNANYETVIEDIEKLHEIDELLRQALGEELWDKTTMVEGVEILCEVMRILPARELLIDQCTPQYIKDFNDE